MKKKITFISLMLLMAGMNVNGQVTLGAGDFATPGLHFIYYGSDTTSAHTSLVTLGTPGGNGTYAINAGINAFIVDTFHHEHLMPSQTPFPTNHPNSNDGMFSWPVMLDAGIGIPDTVAWLWTFYDSSPTGLIMNGLSAVIDTQMFGTTIPGPLLPYSKNYNPGLTVMSSSFNLGYHVHDSIYHCIVIGQAFPIARIEYITRDIEIDGWGTLTTPIGTYPVLRGKVTVLRAENYVLPADTVNPTFQDYFYEYYYEFYAKGLGEPVAILHMEDDFSTVLTVSYTNALPTTVEEYTETSMSIYPNPATDVIRIGCDMTAGQPLSVWITDLNGQRVMEVESPSLSNINTVDMDVSGLACGVYYISVITEKASPCGKFIKL